MDKLVGLQVTFKDADDAANLDYEADDLFTIIEVDTATQSVVIRDKDNIKLPGHHSIDKFNLGDGLDVTSEYVNTPIENIDRIEQHAAGLLEYPDKKVQIVAREILTIVWDIKR